jgi:hypothetical protein
LHKLELYRIGLQLCFAFYLTNPLGAQSISVAPKLIAFPNQSTGSTSLPLTVTISNTQSIALNVSSIQTSLPFIQTNNCGTSLAAGQLCTINITFSPSAVQYYSSTLTVTDSASNSPQTITLTGSGVARVAISPTQISFPNQAIGTSSAAALVNLSNNQSVPLSIASIQTLPPYSQSNNCGISLAPDQSCSVSVVFSPTTVKYFTSTLTVADSATGSPQIANLTGNGVVPVTYIPAVGGYYFVNQIVFTPSTPQTVTITNNQSVALTFGTISSSADFPFATNCSGAGGTLAAGATCTIQVSFKPQAIGSRNAALTVLHNAVGSPITIPLQGQGIAGSPGSTINVTPPAPCVLPSETEQFSAAVTGIANPAVFWYVDAVRNGNEVVGTISTSGLYTAPPYVGTHVVKAVSQASSSVSGAAAMAVSQTPNYEIYPFVVSIPTGGQQTFQAQTCGVPDPRSVSFSVDNIAAGNATVGTVSGIGVYTAPTLPGKHTVRATDATLNRTSGGVVTVFSSITADFGSRAFTSFPIPANMFGTGRGESIHSVSDRNLLSQAGLTESRLYAQVPLVFATKTPNWAQIDPLISSVQAAGQHAMLQLSQTPSWLQPTTGACVGNQYAAPTDVSQWTQIAVSYVAHMDSEFPNVVQDYEIWNEPDAAGMCSSNHLNSYMAIYGAAAPAMKAQAALDGKTIHVGGPALAGYSSYWLSALLTGATTAPYVDFVSYHQYMYGSTGLQAQWDDYTGDLSLYEQTQDPSNGAFAVYNRVLTEVETGQQPLGAQTPVYITEFNTNWAFYSDCCRNSPTYSPVWNSLFAVDVLDSVYNGSARVPNKMIYFAGSAYPWFCAIGVWDADMDCLYSTGATPVPYPQYYAYQLLASNQYLGLSQGGYMAKSISTPTGGGGLATTAFYTSTQDAVMIVNPTSTAYSQIVVTFANPGFANTQGKLFSIVGGAEIESSPLSFSAQGTSLTTTIAVPPYSVQAISLQ